MIWIARAGGDLVALGAPRDAPDPIRVPFERQEYSPYHFRLGLSVSLGLSISLGLLRRRLSRHISASEGTRQNRKWRRDSETCSCSGSCAINQCSTSGAHSLQTGRSRQELLERAKRCFTEKSWVNLARLHFCLTLGLLLRLLRPPHQHITYPLPPEATPST